MDPPIDATEALKQYWLQAKCYREKFKYKKISKVGKEKVHIWKVVCLKDTIVFGGTEETWHEEGRSGEAQTWSEIVPKNPFYKSNESSRIEKRSPSDLLCMQNSASLIAQTRSGDNTGMNLAVCREQTKAQAPRHEETHCKAVSILKRGWMEIPKLITLM
jgi:hypothetical protein